jgi:hypothetical protein
MGGPNLAQLHRTLATACRAVEVFGPLTGPMGTSLAVLAGVFRELVQVAHPDHCPGEQALAERTLQWLRVWRERAQEEIRKGVYGVAVAPVRVDLRTGSYEVHEALRAGDYATVYRCTERLVPGAALEMKVARGGWENEWLGREAEVLRRLGRGPVPGRRYFPRLVETFLWRDGAAARQAVLAEVRAGLHSLAEIRAAYPAGLDPRDAAWMFNRTLEALWFAHEQGLVHGAVLPGNLYVSLEDHGLILEEWALAVEPGEPLKAVSAPFIAWYSAEVRRRAAATLATDLALVARCLVYLLGGDPVTGRLPAGVPGALVRFVRGCVLPTAHGPQDAGALREEFDEVLSGLYGRRAFRPLAMPA